MTKIDFTTIRGVEQWTGAFPEQFGSLTHLQQRHLANALANGAHEGWQPTAAEVQCLADQVSGKRARPSIEELLERATSIREEGRSHE